MPADSHLQWQEIRNFSPGLWTESTQLMPPTAAQVMEDCYPDPSGSGLRAFYAPITNLEFTDILGAPVVDADKTIMGFHVTPNMYDVSGGPVLIRSNRLMVVRDTADVETGWQLWEKEETAGNGWEKRYDFDDGVGGALLIGQSSFVTSPAATNGDETIFQIVQETSPESGAWRYSWGDAAPLSTNLAGVAATFVATHQDRVLSASGGELKFTIPGDPNTSGGDITPAFGVAGGIAWVLPIPPSDLLVGLLSGRIFNIQGDLADPIVRELSRVQPTGLLHVPVATPFGAVILSSSDGLVVVGTDGEFVNFSQQIDNSFFEGYEGALAAGDSSLGYLAFLHGFLWAPKGLVYDFATKSFFQTSAGSTNGSIFPVADPTIAEPVVWYPPESTNDEPSYVRLPKPGTANPRATNFTWKSAPLREPSGRQIEIREVQLAVRTFSDTADLTVTVNGTARTVAPGAAGRHHIRFLFRERAEQLDVQVYSDSNTSAEAPSIETVRIGTRPGHLL